MTDLTHKPRYLAKVLPNTTKNGLVLITGARQTGKTTIAKEVYSELTYFNLDIAEYREMIARGCYSRE